MTSVHSVRISAAYVLLLLDTTTIPLGQPGNIVSRTTLIDHIPRPTHESMSDSTQTSPDQAPDQGPRTIDPARLKAMKTDVEAKYAGTQEALGRNQQTAEEDNAGRQGLRAKHMEGIVKHHDD
ncbi:unnamed protein product [Rhizoctonia solani]|uniref:Uncharacterized protein n=1 Tax=Rhizoctonia solani TaxID=456999 RepID=A0A8H2WQV6_9AGAM|nr:unnamed protein product [Rhizoctonia solani]CAE6475488.1 unnamed protein product [Rhizoctonia solani]